MSVEITLDKPRTLKFDLLALGELETKCEKPMVTVYMDLLRRGVNTLVYALWAGMHHEDPTLTPNLTRKLLQDYMTRGEDVQRIVDALERAMKDTGIFGKDDDAGNAPPEPVAT